MNSWERHVLPIVQASWLAGDTWGLVSAQMAQLHYGAEERLFVFDAWKRLDSATVTIRDLPTLNGRLRYDASAPEGPTRGASRSRQQEN